MKTKFVATNMDGKKKFVGEIDEKYVDQNKPANFNIQNKEGIRSDLICPFFNDQKRSLSKFYL